jgi:hypothetical protein
VNGVQGKSLAFRNVSGKLNPADIFTKEMRVVLTSDVYGTLSCLVCLNFFKPLFWQFIMDDNCFQHLYFLLLHKLLCLLVFLPTLQLWHLHLSVEILLRSLISVVRDVNYFTAYMDSFRPALYDILSRAFLGWTSLCFGPSPFSARESFFGLSRDSSSWEST